MAVMTYIRTLMIVVTWISLILCGCFMPGSANAEQTITNKKIKQELHFIFERLRPSQWPTQNLDSLKTDMRLTTRSIPEKTINADIARFRQIKLELQKSDKIAGDSKKETLISKNLVINIYFLIIRLNLSTPVLSQHFKQTAMKWQAFFPPVFVIHWQKVLTLPETMW